MADEATIEGAFLPGSVDDKRVALLRLVLSLTALLITVIDPSEPEQFVAETYLTLGFFCGYSFVLYLFSLYRPHSALFEFAHWVDVMWFSTLVAFSSGSSSIFFFFYLFAVLVASFRWGFKSGIRVAIVSAALFIATAAFTIGQAAFELNRLLLRPAYLMLFGYLIAYWGGRELLHRRRLSVLAEVSREAASGSNAESSVESLLRSLRKFYEAEQCLLLFSDGTEQGADWFEVTAEGDREEFTCDATTARFPLLKVLGDLTLILNRGKIRSQRPGEGGRDDQTGIEASEAREICDTLKDLLDSRSFLTVPLIRNGQIIGRIYVTNSRSGFEDSDTEFISHLAAQVATSIENERLMESLASGAVSEQRRKISFDIHDGTIQPYIGLKLGLEALEMKAEPGSAVARDTRRLIEMADATISDLRSFVSELKDSSERRLGEVLGSAFERLARQFQENHGIEVVTEIDEGVTIGDRLAAELFQMTAEGLSNIRRHAGSRKAAVRVKSGSDSVVLEIENSVDAKADSFVPGTIAARADSLGGKVTVALAHHATKVRVEIPMSADRKH